MVALHERLKNIMNSASDKNSTRSSRSKTAVTSINCKPKEWTKYVRSIYNRYNEVRLVGCRCCRKEASSFSKKYAWCWVCVTIVKLWNLSILKNGRAYVKIKKIKVHAAADMLLIFQSHTFIIIKLFYSSFMQPPSSIRHSVHKNHSLIYPFFYSSYCSRAMNIFILCWRSFVNSCSSNTWKSIILLVRQSSSMKAFFIDWA